MYVMYVFIRNVNAHLVQWKIGIGLYDPDAEYCTLQPDTSFDAKIHAQKKCHRLVFFE